MDVPLPSSFDPDLDRAPEAVARALLPIDGSFAALLDAECQRLRDDSAENRARERQLLDASYEARAQFSFLRTGLFGPLSRFDDEERSYVWLYDSDFISVHDADVDGGWEHGEDPWRFNVHARDRLVELWQSPVAASVSSLRLCLFGGTSGMKEVLLDLHAGDRVTHLTLRTEKMDEHHAPVSAWLPSLRGLRCAGDEVCALLAEGAPELRALVVHPLAWDAPPRALAGSLPQAHLPKLRHLGVFHEPTTTSDLDALLAHPLLEHLTSLEIFSLNHVRTFPYEALLARRDALAHLRRILLTGHLVPGEVRSRFIDWPEVEWVGYDRRETIAFDFETTGWAAGAR